MIKKRLYDIINFMKTNHLDLKSLILFSFMAISAILAFSLFSRYIGLILISFIIVQLFHPVYRFLKNKLRNTGIATAISVILVLLFIIIPAILITLMIVTEIQNIASSTQVLNNLGNLEVIINNIIKSINDLLGQLRLNVAITQINISQIISGIDSSYFFNEQVIPFVRDLASLSGEILLSIFLIILSLIYLFPLYERLPKAFSRISPLEEEIDQIIITRFKNTLKGVVKGTFVVALLQATAVIIPLMIMNVGATGLLWVLMVILSIIPIGSGLIWGPIGFAIIINGTTTGNIGVVLMGVALIVYSGVIINIIDTTVRPKLMKNAVNIHPLITIFSVLGGISLFGFIGIIYGPLITVLFLTMMEVYRKRYTNETD